MDRWPLFEEGAHPVSELIRLQTPLTEEDVRRLHAGDRVLISGPLIGARDAAHRRLVETLKRGEPLPVDLRGQVVYYTGPSPAREGQVIGAAGPTTSIRIDAYSEYLMQQGMRGMIGKGNRGPQCIEWVQKYGCVYFAAIGGLGALLSQRIRVAKVVAYEDLGTEAVRLYEVEDFPVVVINDVYGRDFYREAPQQWRSLAAAR
ncbi:MAG: fumarate hydratase C-terminal domain-containing protein [Armatimonadetes bacterium]|nr:fumarate hydratase C-terminal domain-containing protein [Armatimonadota bacterium]